MKNSSTLESIEHTWKTSGAAKALECLRSFDHADTPPEDIPLWIELEALILYSNSEFLEALKSLYNGMHAYPDNLRLRRCYQEKKAYTKSLFIGWAKQGAPPNNFYEHLKSFIFYSEVFNPQDLLDIFKAGISGSRDLAKEKDIFRSLATNCELFREFYQFNEIRLERLLMPVSRRAA